MKITAEQLEKLLALKRYEVPQEGYWQDFLGEFHHRQRQQVVASSGLTSLWNRVTNWIADVKPTGWAYGAGLAYATATLALVMIPRETAVESHSASPVNFQVVPSPVNFQVVPSPAKPVEQLEKQDVNPKTPGRVTGQVF